MSNELQAQTPPGRRLVALAESLAADFATRADRHDREASYPHENAAHLRDSGFAYAPIPAGCGGMGVESVHDLLVASSRLARGDASVTIGINMHLAAMSNLARHHRIALAIGNEAHAAGLAATMQRMVATKALIAAAISEPNQDLLRPKTTATRTGDGWSISGRKVFGTMAPAATLLNVAVTFRDDAGEERYGFALVPPTAPGVTLHDDWDALGMRASGSGSISFEDVRVPLRAIQGGFPAGRRTAAFLDRYLLSGPLHAAASLGIAESADEAALAALCRARPVEHPALQMLAADNAIDLLAARSTFARIGSLIDAYHAEHPRGGSALPRAQAVVSEVQCGKTFIHEAAIRIVDRALSMAGGSAYLNRGPLARHYRDVRAGPFMHPFSTTAAREQIARVRLQLDDLPAAG